MRKKPYQLLLFFFILVYIAYFSFFSILRHRTFNSDYYDLGIMDQTVYNTSRGRILELTDPTGSQTIKRMAIHNDILLAALAPFYWIYPHPETLLIIQAVVLGLGALFIFKLAQLILKSDLFALSLAFSYLMYPPLQWSTIYDFHPVTLATAFLLAVVYFAYTKRYRLSFFFLIFSLFSKEQIALVCTLFGLYLVFDKENSLQTKKFGILVSLLSLFWFIVSIWIIIPAFRQGEHFAITRYSEFGGSTSEIIKGIITHPDIVLRSVTDKTSFTYINNLLSPLLYIPLLSPFSLIVTPELALNLLSNNTNQRDIIYHYTAVITPFLFIGAIWGLSRFKKKQQILVGGALLIATLFWSYKTSPLPYSRNADMRPLSPDNAFIDALSVWQQRLNDENIKIAATSTLAPHFSDRKVIIRFSQSYKGADYVILYKKSIENDWYDYKGTLAAYADLIANKNYQKVDDRLGFEVFKKIN